MDRTDVPPARRDDHTALVTVVLPCFNAAGSVEGAVQSLREQVDVDLEIVVVDDASGDDTAAIVERIVAVDDRVRLIRLAENGGVAAARERAVHAARGVYVWFVDDDDTWPADAAAVLVRSAQASDADIVCAAAVVVADGREPRDVGRIGSERAVDRDTAFRLFLRGDITGHLWNKLFRRDVLEHIEFTRIRQHSDQAMVAQALARANRIAMLPRGVYTYRLRPGSIIRSGSRRADALRTLGDVVHRSAAAVDAPLLNDRDYLYYRARYNLLSRMKDATSGAYPAEDERRLVREIRSEMSLSQLVAIARRKDATRFALFSMGWAAPGVYRVALDRAGGRL